MPSNPKSSSGVHIRLASNADIAAMAAVVNAAFAIETFLEGQRTDEAGITEMMKKGGFLLAEDLPGRSVACVYVETSGERGYFGMLAVDPSEQSKGLGRVMVEAAEDYCRRRGCEFMEISVLSLRTELLPFYRKFGYLESGRQEFHSSRRLTYGLECHCIMMSKLL
jgi:GNAT superfamily N-acetyltransferase